MINHIPLQILGLFFKFYKNIRGWIFRALKVKTFGVRALIFNEENECLLLRHTYCEGWYTPGGTVEYDGTPLDAIKREIYEEVSIILEEQPQLFSVYLNRSESQNDLCILYTLTSHKKVAFKNDRSEISRINWFFYEKLSEDLTPSTLKRLREYYGENAIEEFW